MTGQSPADLTPTLADLPKGPVGVAVSGGSDSLALLHLVAQAARTTGHTPHAVTVDHGLRADAADEIALVAGQAADLGVPHTVLRWDGWDGTGNLQSSARDARYALMANWAQQAGIGSIALGHTRDDVAETFLMRLARSGGVDGLSAMPARFSRHGVTWVRPLTGVARAELRAWLLAQGHNWADDPSNADSGFDRVMIRRALATLAPLGVTAKAIARSAEHLREARDALEVQARDAANQNVQTDRGDVVLSSEVLEQPAEIRRRLFLAAITWIAGPGYPPRTSAVDGAFDAIAQGHAHTLGGCLVLPGREAIRITREPAAVAAITSSTDDIWDGRWQLEGPHAPGLEVRALGDEGLRACDDWRATGLPRQSLAASPAIWQHDRLIAAPLAGFGPLWTARIVADFTLLPQSH